MPSAKDSRHIMYPFQNEPYKKKNRFLSRQNVYATHYINAMLPRSDLHKFHHLSRTQIEANIATVQALQAAARNPHVSNNPTTPTNQARTAATANAHQTAVHIQLTTAPITAIPTPLSQPLTQQALQHTTSNPAMPSAMSLNQLPNQNTFIIKYRRKKDNYNFNINVTNYTRSIELNNNPEEIPVVFNNNLEPQAHELRDSLFIGLTVNTNVNIRNLYDPTIALAQLRNISPKWRTEFQAFPHEHCLTSVFFGHDSELSSLLDINLFLYSTNTIVAPFDQIDARQTCEFLQKHIAQTINQQHSYSTRALDYNDIAFCPYIAIFERQQQFTRFSDYVTLFLTFTEANRSLVNNVAADQQLIVAPLVILNMIDQYIT